MCRASQISSTRVDPGSVDLTTGDDDPVIRSWLPTAFAVALNASTLVGVIVWGWPAGNIYLLFWIENAVIGISSVPRIVTARGPGKPALINGRPASPGALAGFFVLHYGIFCTVHAVFAGFVAYFAGVRLTFAYLGLPALLVVIRYAVETATTWFGPDGRRCTVSPAQAAVQPYTRIIVLHVAVLAAFGITLSRMNGGRAAGDWERFVEPLVRLLPAAVQSTGTLAVIVLVLIKSVVDVITTRRAAGPRPGETAGALIREPAPRERG